MAEGVGVHEMEAAADALGAWLEAGLGQCCAEVGSVTVDLDGTGVVVVVDGVDAEGQGFQTDISGWLYMRGPRG